MTPPRPTTREVAEELAREVSAITVEPIERALLAERAAARAEGRAEALEEAADAIERRARGPCDDSRAIRALATKEHA